MKITKQLLQRVTLILLFAFLFQNMNAADIYSAQNGDWTISSTWVGGNVPTTADNVIISHKVTVSSVVANPVLGITIDLTAGAELFFTGSGTLTPTGFITVNKFTTDASWTGTFNVNGIFVIDNDADVSLSGSGTINAGTSIDDYLTMHTGATWNWSAGVVNVAGYAHLEGGTLNITNTVTMNISTAGTRNDVNDNKKILSAFAINFSSSSDKIDFIVENFNTGSGSESYTEAYSTSGSGTVGVKFENTANATGHTLMLKTTQTSMAPLETNIGTGNTLFIESENGGPLTTSIPSINVTSGSINLSWWIDMIVNNNFVSASSDELIIDGIIHVNGTLTLNGSGSINNIIGDGQVSATTYNLGSNDVFGVTPSDGRKSAGGNWIGNTDADWDEESNWSKKIPTDKTIVLISIDYLGTNKPAVIASAVMARTVELDGTDISLTVNSSATLTTAEKGSSGQGGEMVIGAGTSFIVDGGETVIATSLNADDATVTVENGGTLKVATDFNVNANTTVNITSNSAVKVGVDNW